MHNLLKSDEGQDFYNKKKF